MLSHLVIVSVAVTLTCHAVYTQMIPVYYLQNSTVYNNSRVPSYFISYPVYNNTQHNFGPPHKQPWHSQIRQGPRAAPVPSNWSHNLITGIPQYGDVLVFNRTVKDEPYTRWGKVVEYVKYPPHGTLNYRNISVIQVLDYMRDGTGGWPFITEGGVGYRNCTIKLKSQAGKAMRFQVVIYVR